MKKCIIFLVLLYSFISCEDVVDVNLPSEDSRLVIDAIILVDETQQFIPIEIKFSLSSSFFESVVTTSVDNAVVVVEELDAEGNLIDTTIAILAETNPGTGIYVPDNTLADDQRIPTAILDKNVRFSLGVSFQERIYAARTLYAKAPPIDRLEQKDGNLFGGNETEIAVTFTDIPNEDNFYIFDFDFNEFLPTEDTFYKNEQFEFSYFYDDELTVGLEVEIGILGSDLSFFNYMALLLSQSQGAPGPFQTPAATIRGNIFDVTDVEDIDSFDNVNQPDNFPLGYFAVVQKFTETIIIE